MDKVFQLISSVQLGGAEIIAMELAEHCSKSSGNPMESVLVELYPTRDNYAAEKKRELATKNIRVITLFKGKKRMSLIFAPFRLIKEIIREKPAIIHSHTDLPDLTLSVAIRIGRLSRIKFPRVARTIHNTQLWRSHHLLGKITEQAFIDDRVAAVSSYAMSAYEQLRKKYGLPISGYRQIIYNGAAIPKRLPHPFSIDKKKINIAFCGRFEDYKGMEVLIPAIEKVEERYPSRFLFHVIGDGTYKSRLQQLSRSCPAIILYEPVPGISSMLYPFSYLFMPSHFEGLGLISIESSLGGVPVIASYAPGLDETLPGEWPLRFHLDREDELHDIFAKINDGAYNREELSEYAFRFAAEKFSLEKMITIYSKLYNEIL